MSDLVHADGRDEHADWLLLRLRCHHLARYCDARAQAAPVGSILQVGMAARHLKYSVNLGDYERARARLPRLRAAVLGRHGIDIDDPSATMTTRACGVLVGVHYFLGILALNGDGDRARAASHFAASAEAAKTLYRTHGEYRDPAPRVPCARAPSHRARLCPSTASSDPQSVVRGGRAVRRGAGDTATAVSYHARTAAITSDLSPDRRFPRYHQLRTRLRG
jgi:hypothetical protein